jgi:hypothetical protein
VLENACMVKRSRGLAEKKKKVGDGIFRFLLGLVGYILGYILCYPAPELETAWKDYRAAAKSPKSCRSRIDMELQLTWEWRFVTDR